MSGPVSLRLPAAPNEAALDNPILRPTQNGYNVPFHTGAPAGFAGSESLDAKIGHCRRANKAQAHDLLLSELVDAQTRQASRGAHSP